MTGRGTRSFRILGKWLGILALTAAACAAGSTLRTRTWNLEKDSDGRDCAILYDILIKQTGRIDSDWDGTVLDVEKYSRVTFEPYDLKWLEKVAEPGAKAAAALNFSPVTCSLS